VAGPASEIDCAPRPAPWDFLAERNGYHLLSELSDVIPEILFAAVIATADWAALLRSWSAWSTGGARPQRAKYGVSLAQARAIEDKAVALAQREGLPFAVDRVVANSFDVHRVLHLAGTFGLADQLLGVLQRILFGGQANAFDHTVIADAASRLGIPRHRVGEVLASNEYADAVRADEAEARRIGVTGVPFAVFGGRTAIPGAASGEGYAKAIEQAWSRQ
jgi:predicted DsbA family dithiol-disulfide isomerase